MRICYNQNEYVLFFIYNTYFKTFKLIVSTQRISKICFCTIQCLPLRPQRNFIHALSKKKTVRSEIK